MGRRGPQPKPTALKKLEGNPGKRRINKKEPSPRGKPSPPAMLDRDGKAEFRRLMAALPPGMLTRADRAVMSLHADAWSMYTQTRKEIEEHGILGVGSTGNDIVSPRISVLKFSAEVLLKTADRLGLSPAVRTRLETPSSRGQENEEDEKLAQLIALPGGRTR